jgi:hypothetical protein
MFIVLHTENPDSYKRTQDMKFQIKHLINNYIHTKQNPKMPNYE